MSENTRMTSSRHTVGTMRTGGAGAHNAGAGARSGGAVSRGVSAAGATISRSMVRTDVKRMLIEPMTWIFLGIAFAMPVLILVMMTAFGGMEMTDPSTGVTSTMEPITNTWSIIATSSDAGLGAMMSMTSMLNINLVYFMVGIFLCLFIGEDFRGGYAKNLFTVRVRKADYVWGKTAAGILLGIGLLAAFFLGAVVGGKIAGLSFALGSGGVFGLVLCMAAKVALLGVFVPIFVAVAAFGKQRVWLSILIGLFAGMLLFMIVPMMSPLDTNIMQAGMCLAGGVLFCLGLSVVSKLLLTKRDILA